MLSLFVIKFIDANDTVLTTITANNNFIIFVSFFCARCNTTIRSVRSFLYLSQTMRLLERGLFPKAKMDI